MRVKVQLCTESGLNLPLNYNNIIQSVILNNLSFDLSKFFHDIGYKYEKRGFKLYTFSDILGEYTIYNSKDNNSPRIAFNNDIIIYISSPIQKFIRSLGDNLIENGKVTINRKEIPIRSVKLILDPPIENPLKIEMISPVTMYSTFRNNRAKKTYYYRPDELDFSILIEKNLIHKYKAFYEKEPQNSNFVIEPLDDYRKVIKIYKGFVIEGYKGQFIIKGSRELLEMAYNAGIGGKNSLGFGCFRILNK
jgi:CRISPR-associated endoribonuclease Cas6